MNKNGLIDGIMSEDFDCFVFGGDIIIRENISQHGNQRSKIAHLESEINVYRSTSFPVLGLSRGALILIALIAGGDYDDV